MKKTLRRTILPLFVGAIFICAFASSAGAIPLTYTDIAKDISYNLDINEATEVTEGGYSVTFTITTGEATPSDLRIGWVAFKLGSTAEIDAPDIIDDSEFVGQWAAGNDKSAVMPWGSKGKGKKKPFHNQWAGFYSEEIASSKSKGKSGGLELAANTAYTFEFTINDPDMLFTEGMPFEEIPFRVGFYSGPAGKSGKIETKNTKGTFSSVPEPATLLLVGSGLLLVGLFGRRKFKRGR